MSSYIFFFLATIFTGCTCQITTREQLIQSYASQPAVNYGLANAQRTEVVYKFSSPTEGLIVINATTAPQKLNPDYRVVFIIHGFQESSSAAWVDKIKNNYLTRDAGKANIIYVDWSIAAARAIAVSSANVYPVGFYIAEFISLAKIKIETVHVIGYDLGAHVAHFTGYTVQANLNRSLELITGLDPRGPQFDLPQLPPLYHLNKGDAKFVEVHHTDAQGLGVAKQYGHIDFYLNGGYNQPGCPLDVTANSECSHLRAPDLYAASLVTDLVVREGSYVISGTIQTVVTKPVGQIAWYGGSKYAYTLSQGIFNVKTAAAQPYLSVLQF